MKKKENAFSELKIRVLKLIEYLKNNPNYKIRGPYPFEKTVGLSQGFVKGIGNSIYPENLEKISKAFPFLNSEWLKTGHGEMLIEENYKRNDNITHKENVKENAANDNNNVKQDGFSDVHQVDNKTGYSENSTFPERNKPPNDLWTLINNQQKQIKLLHEQNQGIYQQVNLLHQQVEILNKLIHQ